MESFVIPSQVVWKAPVEAAVIARLGALANAVVSVASMNAGSLAVGVGRERDSLQTTLILVGYLKEAVDVFNSRNCRALVLEGQAAGYQLPKPVEELWEPFTKGRQSFYERIAIQIRNTKAFHVDEPTFLKWASELQAPVVTLWRKDSGAPIDWAFIVSAQLQSLTGPTLDQADAAVLQNSSMMSFLVESMAWGLVARRGLNPRDCYTRMVMRQVKIEYEFKDDRSPLTETVPMLMDQTGSLPSFVGAIREHATRVFGGPIVGAGQFKPGEVVLSSPRGKATAAIGSEIPARTVDNPRVAMMRLSDMASWGHLGVAQAIAYVDRVRTGQATPQETAEFIDKLRTDLLYWQQRKLEADNLKAALRNTNS